MIHADAVPTDAQTQRGGSHLPAGQLLSQVSIIVPVGPEEKAWREVLGDLADVGEGAELLLVATEEEPADLAPRIEQVGIRCAIQWVKSPPGRARQLNLGAKLAQRPFVWFLHADCRLDGDALIALEESLAAHPEAIHFFKLQFQNDGPRLVRLNAWGARVRSRCFGLPFGDQGFCLRRALFDRLGGFDERAAYGEDHLFVWAARRQRIPLRCVGATIATSARKYGERGWLKLTAIYAWRTVRQAVPQAFLTLWSRLR